MKLIIDRQKWIYGEPLDSYLLRPEDGKMCCLGIYGQACGIAPEKLSKMQSPVGQIIRQKDNATAALWPKWLFAHFNPAKNIFNHSSDCHTLMVWNDMDSVSQYERECKVSDIFARHGVEIEFIN